MVKRFNSHIKANNDLNEANLFKSAAEKDAIVKDKKRVANAFMYNFFGMLGMINATQPAQKQTILNFLKKDKQLRVDSIDETNLDISQSVKLAHEAGFFINPNTVNEITRFLVKLKMGQITTIDSLVVGKWANALKPDFLTHVSDPAMRRVYIQFRNDEGKTIDVSRFAIALKARVNKIPDGGDFQKYSKRFFGLTEIKPGQAVAAPVAQPAVATPAQPAAPAKLSYYQRQKLKKQQAAQGTTPPVAPTAPATTTTAAPAKLSYYQRQKLKKQQAAQPAIDAAKAAAAAAQAAAELKAKEEEENRKAQAAAIKKMPKEHLEEMIKAMFRAGPYPSPAVYSNLVTVKSMFNFNIVPDIYAQVADRLHVIASNVSSMTSTGDVSTLTMVGDAVRKAFKEITSLTGHETTFAGLVKFAIRLSTTARGSYGGRYTGVLLLTGENITPDLYENTVYQLSADGMRSMCEVLQTKISVLRTLGEMGGSKQEFFDKLCQEGYPVYSYMRMTRSYNAPKSFVANYTYTGYENYAYHALISYDKPFHTVIDNVLKSAGTYGISSFEDTFVAYGITDTSINGISANLVNALQMRFKEFYDVNFNTSAYENLVRRLLRNTLTGGANYGYDASARDGGGPLLQQLHDMFADDLVAKGWTDSKLQKLTGVSFTDYSVKHMLRTIGVSTDDLIKNHPNDTASVYLKVVKDGLNSVDTDNLTRLILADPSSNVINGIIRVTKNLQSNASGDRDTNVNAISKAMLKIAQAQPNLFNFQIAGAELLKQLPYADADTVNGWLRFAKQNNNNWIMGAELYKSMYKNSKQDYVDVLTGIVQDSIGSDVEDYVNDIVDSLPPHVVQKMRGNLVGGAVLIDEIVKGEIKPFDKIDSARLKKIFLYNDIDMSALLTGVVDKKKKSETYVQYFARAKQSMKDKKMLQQAKVQEVNSMHAAKSANRIMIQRDHAGKHGDTYPMIDKVYDANLEYPEFEEFRKTKYGDGSVVPAYHGTGGIAAGMILRYGFKVIKSSDPSVVGRMLGDGIYFSNKIDKVSQYVSNGGYSRQHGQKGYVMEMDTNLGTRNRDYRAAGIDGRDSIRSPEWCVVDPKAQLRVTKVYEVTLVSKATVDKFLKEGVEYTGLKGFKQHLKEQVMQENGNVTSFVFRDGMIPIIDQETAAITYVDFEEALSKKLIKQDMFDVSAQGPVIVFRGTADQVVIDERFADHMGGNDLQLYIQLFREEMSRI